MFRLTSTVIAFSAVAAAAGTPGHRKPPSPDFSHWAPTDQSNLAPCPFTNSLANHGYLDRHQMTYENITSALESVLLLDSALSNLFASASMPLGSKLPNGTEVVSLAQLDKHNKIEHDASLTRNDISTGDNTHFNSTLFDELLSFSSDGSYITIAELARFRVSREKYSRATDKDFTFGVRQQVTAYGEAALLYESMRDDSDKIRVDWIKVLFQEERFPVELGWKPRPLGIIKIASLALNIRLRAAFGWW
ncbi:hypothetical protein HK101_011155 [Irineochytrium annulatum]|nr:hypothetical protein HK101_011155 [Irineochytrium annulatum]